MPLKSSTQELLVELERRHRGLIERAEFAEREWSASEDRCAELRAKIDNQYMDAVAEKETRTAEAKAAQAERRVRKLERQLADVRRAIDDSRTIGTGIYSDVRGPEDPNEG